jgi:hypothetical protein
MRVEILQNQVVGDPYRTIRHVRVHTPVERREQLDLAELGAPCCGPGRLAQKRPLLKPAFSDQWRSLQAGARPLNSARPTSRREGLTVQVLPASTAPGCLVPRSAAKTKSLTVELPASCRVGLPGPDGREPQIGVGE